jgi:hypothetical protein
LIEHAGTVVAGLRALDREAYRLFLPLIYGDVRTWPAEQRRHWADDLIALAHEDRITPALRISLAALSDLGPQQKDRDARQLVESLTRLLALGHSGGLPSDPLDLFTRANVTGMFDLEIGTELDPILEALNNPDQSNLHAIRFTAAQFVYGVDEEVQQLIRIQLAGDQETLMTRRVWSHHPGILKPNDSAKLYMAKETRSIETEPSTNPITTLRGLCETPLSLTVRLLPEMLQMVATRRIK